jgi:guanine nucleotide-binding protein subunit beta-2-like 1 protein
MQVGEKTEGDQQVEFLISGSRDKTIMIWDIIERKETDEEKEWGVPHKILKCHSHFISDMQLSQDSRYCLTASWDGTLRLWDINKGVTSRRFVSHSRDVLACAFSPDNRQIASGGRDKNLKIWNTVGECKFTVEQNAHQDWVSCVKFYQDTKTPIVVSASWDKTIKVWDNQTMSLRHTFVGHKAQINSLDMAPKTSYLASGGKDGLAIIWNLIEGKYLGQTEVEAPINCLLFAPKKYWLVIGTEKGIKVWDLPTKEFVVEIKATPLDPNQEKMAKPIGCTSLAWNKSGNLLFAGFTDNYIRVYKIVVTN